jgi:hypothetical protein
MTNTPLASSNIIAYISSPKSSFIFLFMRIAVTEAGGAGMYLGGRLAACSLHQVNFCHGHEIR